MNTFVARSSNFSPLLSGFSQVTPSILKPIIPGAVAATELVVPATIDRHLTSSSLFKIVPKCNRGLRVGCSLTGSTQVRFAHTDIKIPDFDYYRHDSVKDAARSSKDSEVSRKSFTYLVGAGALGVTSLYSAKTVAYEFISSMSASADVLAMAKIEIKLADIPEGKSMTFKWRGKPLFIRHRTTEDIDREGSVNLGELRDPQADLDRVQKPEWLVLIGVCTHLGCVPIADAGDFGGYYCPCHGSHYDGSGRIRKGPAPLNLEIPEYIFPDEETLVVG